MGRAESAAPPEAAGGARAAPRSSGPADAGDAVEPATGRGPRRGRRAASTVLKPEYALPLVTLALAAYLSFASEFFLTERNLLNITESIAIVGIAAAFATIVLIGGGIDLSPVVTFIISGIVAWALLNDGAPVAIAVAVAIAAGGAIGLLNGLLVAVGNLNPFIVTLGTNFLFTGVAFVVLDGNAVVIDDPAFREIGTSDVVGNVSSPTVFMLAAFVLAFCILRFTRFGVHVFAIGGDVDAARLSGVPVVRVTALIYVIAGLAAGVAGVVLAASSGGVAPFQASGQNDLLTLLAAAIIGGNALGGGRGTVVGTLIGLLLLGIISNGLVLENISSFWQPVVVGVVLLLAIILDEARRRAALKVAN